MNNVSQEFDDLDWQAFRYIANEMTEAERAAFEERLGQDQRACEVVARMVELANGVVCTAAVVAISAAPDSASRVSREVIAPHISPRLNTWSRPRWQRAAAWVTAVAASLVAAILLYQPFNSSTDPSTLAQLWARVRSGSETLSPPDTELLAGFDDAFMATEDETELSVPAWVIEAVGSGSESDQREDS